MLLVATYNNRQQHQCLPHQYLSNDVCIILHGWLGFNDTFNTNTILHFHTNYASYADTLQQNVAQQQPK